MTTYNQAGFLYNQTGAIYDQSAVERTATGDGTGTSSTTTLLIAKRTALSIGESDSTAATKVTQLRLGALTDFSFPYRFGGRFYLGVRAVLTVTATASGLGTASSVAQVLRQRQATGSGLGDATAVALSVRIRTATGSGVGTQDSTGLYIAPRAASASGVGSATTISIHVVIRTGTGTGQGTANASAYLTAIRTSSGAGEGTSTTVGARAIRRTCTGLGDGTSTADWDKSHIFRVPTTTGYPFAERLSTEPSDRLFSFTPQGIRAYNLYKLTDGTYQITDPRRPERIVKVYLGGHDNFLDATEIAELTAAGFGSSIT